MKGLFVILAVVAFVNAGVPAKSESRGLMEDMRDVQKCLSDVAESLKEKIADTMQAVEGLGTTVAESLASLKECSAMEDPEEAAQCIATVGESLKEGFSSGIFNIQKNIVDIIKLNTEMINCFMLITKQ